MNQRYQLQTHGPNYSKPYYIAKYILSYSKETGFWQQISPSYLYKANAINFAKRNNITLENQ